VYGLGGDSGAGGTNTGIGLMAALGQCPASAPFNFATADPFVFMNEVTTVAAAYAMAGFATDATHVSANNTTLGIQGLANSFANAGSLATISNGTANSYVPGNQANSTVPQQEINTLANILAACVNSLTGSSACTTLFSNAESAGSSGTAPTDTATAAINIAHNPANAITALYGLQTGLGSAPYPTDLSSQPNDFTVRLAFTGGGLTATEFEPQGLAIDGFGNVWIASDGANVLVEFSPLGVPANATGFGSIGLNVPNSVAIDAASANVWVANSGTNSVTDFTIAGATAVSYTTGINGPGSAQIDGSGNVWVADAGNSTGVKLNGSTGAVLATATGNGLGQSQSLSIEPGAAGNVWFVYGASRASIFTDAGTAVGEDTAGGINSANGTAIDAGGFVWIANNGNSVSKLDSGGVTGSNFSLPTGAIQLAVAIDGSGNSWFTSQSGAIKTIFELNNSGTNLSGTAGFLPASGATPGSLGIDGSGNVWYTDDANPTVYELIGAATPVVTPIAYAVANNLLGTTP
jgi:streptogramin lyase